MKVVWTIAGSDSGGGAGLQADLKTFASFGVHGASVVTGLTAQNTHEITAVEATSDRMLDAQIEALLSDLPPLALKTGMLGSVELIEKVADAVSRSGAFYTCDPVITSSSGTPLLQARARDACAARLFPLAGVVTPNVVEAEIFAGMAIRGPVDMERAAGYFLERGARAVLLKGGHLAETKARDYFTDGTRSFWLSSTRVPGLRSHGTGCTLSSAIAAGVAKGWPLEDAVVAAKAYVTRALSQAWVSPSGVALLRHAPWPTPSDFFPIASPDPEPPALEFPSLEKSLGFYPIVARAEWIDRLAELGTRTFQIRIKDLTGTELEREIAAANRAARRHDAQLFVNDHWEIALKIGAYGVHLGQEDLQSADMAVLSRAGVRMGLSTHTLLELSTALAFRPSYVALGPIYPTRLKAMRFGPQGLERIADWASLANCPLVAIGGLTPETASLARAAGAQGLAVITDLFSHAEPLSRARQWLSALG